MTTKEKEGVEGIPSDSLVAQEGLPPLTLTVSTNRQTGRFGIAHNIIPNGDGGEKDISMLIEALSSIIRDLNTLLVEVRVSTALNGQEKE